MSECWIAGLGSKQWACWDCLYVLFQWCLLSYRLCVSSSFVTEATMWEQQGQLSTGWGSWDYVGFAGIMGWKLCYQLILVIPTHIYIFVEVDIQPQHNSWPDPQLNISSGQIPAKSNLCGMFIKFLCGFSFSQNLEYTSCRAWLLTKLPSLRLDRFLAKSAPHMTQISHFLHWAGTVFFSCSSLCVVGNIKDT